MRVDADLNLLHAETAKLRRFFLSNHHAVRFYFDIEQELSRPFYDGEKVPAHENFSAADRQKKYAGIGQLIEQFENFSRRHFAMVIMVEITMHAALVASVGNIEMDAQRYAQVERFLVHLGEKTHEVETAGEESNG